MRSAVGRTRVPPPGGRGGAGVRARGEKSACDAHQRRSVAGEQPTIWADSCSTCENDDMIAPSMWKHQRLAVTAGKPFHELLYVNFVTGCATMVRRRLVQTALPFPNDCIMHDWWLSVLSARTSGGGIALLPEPLTHYRQHGANVVGAHDGRLAASIRRAPTLQARCTWYHQNMRRIEGYLARPLWDDDDRRLMLKTISLFSVMARDDTNNFITRLASLPQRLRYALPFGGIHTAAIVTFAIIPRAVDWLRRLSSHWPSSNEI